MESRAGGDFSITPRGPAREPSPSLVASTPDVPWSDPLAEQARAAYDQFLVWLDDHRRAFGVWATVGVLLLGAGVWAGLVWRGEPDCPPPLELRVLTSPESREALADVAEVYEASLVNRRPLPAGEGGKTSPEGCRAARFTVYASSADQVAAAFAHLDRWNGTPVTSTPGATQDAGVGDEQGTGADDPDADPSGSSTPQGSKTAIASGAFQPLTAVGPQPDIWIPDSSAELALVKQKLTPSSVAELHGDTPIAYSPLVVGLPANVSAKLPPGRVDTVSPTWDDLLLGLKEVRGMSESTVSGEAKGTTPLRLLRPAPTTSGTGLLHTVGRYLATDGSLPRDQDDVSGLLDDRGTAPIEKQLSAFGFPAGDSVELLEALRAKSKGGDTRLGGFGALVSEKALVDFNRGDEKGDFGTCHDPAPRPEAERLRAYYPRGVPALDHPFVRVSWNGASKGHTSRSAAISRFRAWVLGERGQAQLVRAHYRPRDRAEGASPTTEAVSPLGCEGTGAEPTSPVYRADVRAPLLQKVLGAYEEARSPARVLVLYDVPPSPGQRSGHGEAARVASSALRVLGPNDTFGVWATPASDRDSSAYRELVRLDASSGPNPKAEGEVPPAPGSYTSRAAMYAMVSAAVDTMRRSGGLDRQAILLVTDRGDDPIGGRDPEAERDRLNQKLIRVGAPRVPILIADVHRPGCSADLPYIARLSSESSVCLPSSRDVGKKLAGLLAVVDEEGDR